MAKTKTAALLELPVSYGNVNIGDEIARLTIKFTRTALALGKADQTFCGKRLTGRIVARAGDAQGEQDSLPGAEDDAELTGSFDVTALSVTRKTISTGLSFSIASIQVETLARFAKRQGVLIVDEIGDIPEDEADAEG